MPKTEMLWVVVMSIALASLQYYERTAIELFVFVVLGKYLDELVSRNKLDIHGSAA